MALHLWIKGAAAASTVLFILATTAVLFADYSVSKIYPNLDLPFDNEAPPTFRSYPSSSITEAIIGGRGRGIDCSIPGSASLFFHKVVKSAGVNLHFRQACAMHDLCYRHGFATYGYSQQDCDRQLQESAFRLCRQIFQEDKTDVTDSFKLCETEAKKVYFGVIMGGAGSFMPAGRSTYFEYDPMPERASDYVVARELPSIFEFQDDFGVVSLHFNRQSVILKHINSPCAYGRREIVFPREYIATPPDICNGCGFSGSLISIARRSKKNTAMSLLYLDEGIEVKEVKDMDSVGTKIVYSNGNAAAISLNYRDNIDKVELNTLSMVFQNIAGGDRKFRLADYGVNDRYRFLQHDWLVERDSDGVVSHAWVIGRGIVLDESNKIKRNRSGERYKDSVLIARRGVSDGYKMDQKLFSINAPESHEPFSLIRLGKDKGVAMIGIGRVNDRDRDLVNRGEAAEYPANMLVWRLIDNSGDVPSDPQSLALPKETKFGFVDIPPVVIRTKSHNEPILVLANATPVCPSSRKCDIKNIEASFILSNIKAYDNGKVGIEREKKFSFEIDVLKQVNVGGENPIKKAAERIFGSGDGLGGKEGVSDAVNSWAANNFANRWRMSQLVVIEKPGNKLALTMVFNGYPSMSFQVIFSASDDGAKFERILPRSSEAYIRRIN